jgi:hypothetical protein
MKIVNRNPKANLILSIFVFCAMIVFLYSCGNGGSGDDSSETGSVNFGLVLQDQDTVQALNSQAVVQAFQAFNIRAAANSESQFECRTETYEIATIEVQVLNENGVVIAEGGPWDCEDRNGTIGDVEAGDNRIVKVFAKDESGKVVAEGKSDLVTVIADQTVNAGTIILTLVKNRPPVMDPVDDPIVNEDQQFVLTIHASDPDDDELTYSATNLPNGASFSGQTFSWKPDFDASGQYTIVFTVTDISTEPLSDFQEMTITVENINRPPEFIPFDVLPFDLGQLTEITLDAQDPDIGDVLTCSADLSDLPAGSDANFDPATCTFSWTPTLDEFLVKEQYIITFTVTDDGNPPLSDTMERKPTYTWNWIETLSTPSSEEAFGIAVDSTPNVYITGYTRGNLDENKNLGGQDIFIAKYDKNGNKLWTTLFGTEADDSAWGGVALDPDANIYIAGETQGGLGGNVNAGGLDAFIAKYDTDGNRQWTTLLGTPVLDSAYSIAVDSNGNSFISGGTQGDLGNNNQGGVDVFVAKYDTNGNRQWIRQFGSSSDDWGRAIAVDINGNCYIAGATEGNLFSSNQGGSDIFIAKYDTNGNQQWTDQFGTPFSDVNWDGLAVDSEGNCYLTGSSTGDLDGNINAGGVDIYLSKYDPTGNRLWTKLFGTSLDDSGLDITMDQENNLYITGSTAGDLDGKTNAGGLDTYATKFDKDGNRKWTELFGGQGDEIGRGIAVDWVGNNYVTGNRDLNESDEIFIWRLRFDFFR